MKIAHATVAAALIATLSAPVTLVAGEANLIAPQLGAVEVLHNGKKVVITREESKDAHIPEVYTKSGRHCPPFCIQPMTAAAGVETIGELELIDYLRRGSSGDASVLVIDSRTPDWMPRGTIPGSVNIPWNRINREMSGMFGTADEAAGIEDILVQQLGAKRTQSGWDFSGAKTLVLFCNGLWCPQSTDNIQTLVKMGYPASKLKWYRGGMQDWVTAGLTIVTP
jgi:rhodanese-related sulfurtransferase